MNPVLHSFAYCFDFLCEQVTDVPAEEMAAQPKGVVNHPAWVIGHLTFTCQMLGEVLGLTPWLPEDWAKRYGSGSVPVADSTLYENKGNSLTMLRDAQSRITQAVQLLDESRLSEPFPDESFRYVFPTIRHAITQILSAHSAYHIGQVANWRRAMGLSGIGRSFE